MSVRDGVILIVVVAVILFAVWQNLALNAQNPLFFHAQNRLTLGGSTAWQ